MQNGFHSLVLFPWLVNDAAMKKIDDESCSHPILVTYDHAMEKLQSSIVQMAKNQLIPSVWTSSAVCDCKHAIFP
ncbi:hypothetical protein Peur_040425 [Populus x canadensis]